MLTPLTDAFGLDQARRHLRLDPDDDDPMIEDCMRAAIDRVEQFIEARLYRNMAQSDQAECIDIPPCLKAAALLYLGDLWENREAATEVKLEENPAVMNLMRPFRENWGV